MFQPPQPIALDLSLIVLFLIWVSPERSRYALSSCCWISLYVSELAGCLVPPLQCYNAIVIQQYSCQLGQIIERSNIKAFNKIIS